MEPQRGIMDAVSSPAVEQVVVMSSVQVGKTEVINNTVGYYIDQDPAPMLLIQPTLEIGKAWSKDRLAPMVRDTPRLRGKIEDPRSRDSGNTIFHKVFPGGHITIAGANSAASLASRPVRIVLLDEVDRYPYSAGTEGDPVNLARKRATTFWNRKVILTSTPTIKGKSRIEAAFEETDKRFFHVPCPHCEEEQILRWRNVIWPKDRPEDAAYQCEGCGVLWSDVERWRAVSQGRWIASEAFAGKAGFWLNEIYSSWVRLADMAVAFLEAKKLPETLKTFVNTSLAETWEDRGETVDGGGLVSRCDEYGIDPVPEGVCVIVAGVDVQDDRVEAEVVGVGLDEESWSLDYQVFRGDPSTKELWARLDAFLQTVYLHPSGVKLRIVAACVDSGGHHTQAVYKFCKGKKLRRVWAIKGMAGEGRPMLGRPSKNNVGRVDLYPVGTYTAKELLFSRLAIEDPGPGYCHFPRREPYDEEHFEQLTGEKCVTAYKRGVPTKEWHQTRKRVEALDCRVYAMAALDGLNTSMDVFRALLDEAAANPLAPTTRRRRVRSKGI
jgi:phage terminase large subunit GpA-like protein